MHHMDWDDLRFFLAVARKGSIRGASSLLNVNHSTVSRRINGFEETLGLRLFDRQASGYILTQTGENLLATAERVEDEVATLDRLAFGQNMELSGELRVTMPEPLSIHIMPPILVNFCETYPGIELEVATSNRVFNLSHREADVAIRVTNNPPEHLVGKRIISYAKSVYASRSYLAQHHKPEEMQWIGWGDNKPIPWWVKQSDFASTPIKHIANNEILQLQLTKAGLGLTMLPCFLGDNEPTLARVPPGRVLPSQDIWLLTHPDLRHTIRVKTFFRFVADALQKQSALLLGEQPQPASLDAH